MQEGAFLMCPTAELAEYTTWVAVMVEISTKMSGRKPPISRATGEPAYVGETKEKLDQLRNAAGVASLREATAACRAGKGGVAARVVESADGALVLKATDGKTAFWMPKGAALPVR